MKEYCGLCWEHWRETLRERDRGDVPTKIEFPTGKDDKWKEVETPLATIDEIETALVALDAEISRLGEIRRGLDIVRRRARRTFKMGTTPVHELVVDCYHDHRENLKLKS